jgi:hypothetical protein
MYTDAPPLSRKLWWGSLQLFFWLFFHPSAWRSTIQSIDSRLAPNFCLVEVDRSLWRRAAFWRLLLLSYLTWPLVIVLVTLLLLRGLNLPVEGIVLGAMVGLSAGLVASLATSLVGSLAVGTAVGIAVSLVVGVAGGILLSPTESSSAIPLPLDQSFDLLMSTVVGLAGGLAGGLAYGVAAGVAGRGRDLEPTSPLARQVSGMVIGVIVGIAAGRLTALLSGRLAAGVVVGLMFALSLAWRTRHWRHGLIGGLLVGLASSLAGELGGISLSGGILTLVGFSALLMALFVLPYTLAERMAGPWAGALAGALGAAGGLFFFVAETDTYLPLVTFSLVGVLLGLTLAWWRPVLLYPLLAGWNNLLFRLDERRVRNGRASVFRYHSAFWDELQRLRLIGLDTHLLLLLRHRPQDGAAALAYISGGAQRWAAQAAQIELDAHKLETCETVTAVSQAHEQLGAGELTGPASALLRSFSRISQDTAAAQRQESAYNQRLALNAVEDRLDGLVRELTRSDERYANRFRPIATQWRQIIADQTKKLAEEAELRQEIDSPYIIGVPLTQQQEIFIGRADISARIEQLLLDRRQPPLLLYGQRRVGKTSLLHNLGRLLPSTIVPLFVDLQGPASRAQNDAGFLYNMARAMVRSARQQRHLELPPLARETLAADPFTAFDEWLDELETALGEGMALLMLDEFEVLDTALTQSRFNSDAILGTLRHLIQHRPQFKVLLSGSHTLDEFQRWSSYLINVQVIHIGYLKDEEAQQLIETPVDQFALRYEPAASQRILALTRGHPFLIQLLCAEVVAEKNEQSPSQRRLARVADVETAVPAALDHGSFFFADIEQNQVDNVGREVLRLIAAQGEGNPAPRQTLVDYVPSLLALEEALVALQHRELIEPLDGGYRFQVELVRRWFAERP